MKLPGISNRVAAAALRNVPNSLLSLSGITRAAHVARLGPDVRMSTLALRFVSKDFSDTGIAEAREIAPLPPRRHRAECGTPDGGVLPRWGLGGRFARDPRQHLPVLLHPCRRPRPLRGLPPGPGAPVPRRTRGRRRGGGRCPGWRGGGRRYAARRTGWRLCRGKPDGSDVPRACRRKHAAAGSATTFCPGNQSQFPGLTLLPGVCHGHLSDPKADRLLPRPLHQRRSPEDLFARVAPAYIAVAGFDPLRHDGIAFARTLGDAGVPVSFTMHQAVGALRLALRVTPGGATSV